MSLWEYITPELLAKAVTLTFMLLGLVVLLIPILPGLVIIWAIALLYGILDGFTPLAWVMFAIMTVLMVAGSFVDNLLMGTSAHREGAPWWVILLALLAAIPGNIILPIIGGILAVLLVLFLLQWARLKDPGKALISIKGLLVGYGWAIAIRFIIGMVMIGLWLIWAWI